MKREEYDLKTQALLRQADALAANTGADVHDAVVESIYSDAAVIASETTTQTGRPLFDWDNTLDRLLTSRWLGFPIMMILLSIVFWLTIAGANVPSAMIATFLMDHVYYWLLAPFTYFHAPAWLSGFLLDGVYLGLAWVISVMLPPMAIFFPIFTLLEDLGYLPRVALNLDRFFRWAGAHGKQALSMSMGFGCNAAGVIATRIIDSPRERLIAIVTNNFVPCNGRWPTLIMLASIFLAAGLSPALGSVVAAGSLVAVTLFGILVTLLVSAFLSRTWLKGEASFFTLELPPYRRPQPLRILYTSLIDRTIFVLGRAIIMAAPAGGLIWIMANVHIGEESLVSICRGWLDPIGHVIGIDGMILLAYIIAIPANEIIVPTVIMGYLAASRMTELDDPTQIQAVFEANGFTVLTAICFMLFALLHYPCSTTTMTIWKETRSVKWTVLSNLIPLVVAFVVCFIVAQVGRLLGLE